MSLWIPMKGKIILQHHNFLQFEAALYDRETLK